MGTIVAVDRDGAEHELPVNPGDNLMECLRDAGLPVEAICGGQCICSTCHVYVDEKWFGDLPPRNDVEQVLVEDSGSFETTSRLSCQLEFDDGLDGMRLTLAPEF